MYSYIFQILVKLTKSEHAPVSTISVASSEIDAIFSLFVSEIGFRFRGLGIGLLFNKLI